ncbi:hypothetical protein FOA52_004249 [Chlamydomonas sp. UWO 241]|nr:hypothetical protein FOA52_004249 [Chlamydomonas sp. UWO 241]
MLRIVGEPTVGGQSVAAGDFCAVQALCEGGAQLLCRFTWLRSVDVVGEHSTAWLPVPGANKPVYVPGPDDVGAWLKVTATPQHPACEGVSATSGGGGLAEVRQLLRRLAGDSDADSGGGAATGPQHALSPPELAQASNSGDWAWQQQERQRRPGVSEASLQGLSDEIAAGMASVTRALTALGTAHDSPAHGGGHAFVRLPASRSLSPRPFPDLGASAADDVADDAEHAAGSRDGAAGIVGGGGERLSLAQVASLAAAQQRAARAREQQEEEEGGDKQAWQSDLPEEMQAGMAEVLRALGALHTNRARPTWQDAGGRSRGGTTVLGAHSSATTTGRGCPPVPPPCVPPGIRIGSPNLLIASAPSCGVLTRMQREEAEVEALLASLGGARSEGGWGGKGRAGSALALSVEDCYKLNSVALVISHASAGTMARMPGVKSLPPWAIGLVFACIPVGTYTWMITTRPDVYSQVAEEIRRQEEAEKVRRRTHTVFIGNLPWDVTEGEVSELFEQAGPIRQLRVVVDKETGRPKGFAFCEFHDKDSAEVAVSRLTGYDLNGRSLRVDFADDERQGNRGGDRGGGGRGERGDGPRGGGRAAAASEAMASMMAGGGRGGGAGGAPGGPGGSGGGAGSSAHEHLRGVLDDMDPVSLYAVASQMADLVRSNPQAARSVLVAQPHLTTAIFRAQVLLGMVKPLAPDAASAAEAAAAAAAFAAAATAAAPAAAAHTAHTAQQLQHQHAAASMLPGLSAARPPAPAPALPAPPPVIMSAPAAAAPAPPAPVAIHQTQKQALIARLLSLTPAQLDALPPVERAQALQVVNALRAQQAAQLAAQQQLQQQQHR